MDAATKKAYSGAPEDAFVTEVPGVQGGYPILRNSRIPVRVIVALRRQGASVEKLAELYSQLSPESIQGALDYYAAQPARVDEDFARQEQARRKISERNILIQGRVWPD